MAEADILIGVDAGTSVIKSVAFTREGVQLAQASLPNTYTSLPNGGVEQEMLRTWHDAARTLNLLHEQIPNLAERTLAIAVTGQGDGLWMIDKAGTPVAPAWLWLDARSAAIVDAYTSSSAYAAHYARTGTGVNVCQMNVQLAWMQAHNKQLLEKAETAFHCKDWIYFNLTGDRATDPSEANFTFGNYKSGAYQPDILDDLNAAAAKRLLPPIIDGKYENGCLTQAAAKATGFKAGTAICLGYVDVLCTGLGGGLFDPTGQSGCTIIGSTGMHMRLKTSADSVVLNNEKSGYTMLFPVPGHVAQIQSNMASTLNIDWLLDLGRNLLSQHGVQRSRAEMLQGLDQRILARPAGKVLYHPYISQAGERGPFMEPSARAAFNGLDMATNFDDLTRGVFEGLALAARDCYSAMGSVPTEVRITGGAAKSIAMQQIFANVLNASVRVATRQEAGAAGAAMMAAVQQKLFPDMQSCAETWVTPQLGEAVKPDAQQVKTYDRVYQTYFATRQALRPQWRHMFNA